MLLINCFISSIREQITPKGDGNKQIVIDNEDEIEKLENR